MDPSCPHEDKIDHVCKKIDKINVMLMGNGKPENGLIIKVDRLEQFANSSRKALWGIFGVAASVLVVALLNLLGVGGG